MFMFSFLFLFLSSFSHSFLVDVWSRSLFDLSILFSVVPSLVDVIGNASTVFTDHSHQMRTRHAGSKIILALTSPTIVLKIVHQIKTIFSLILEIR